MRVDQHYDDEALIALMEAGKDLSRDAHLTACNDCSDVATTLRQIAATLTHEDVWETRELDEAPQVGTVSQLRAFADEMTREDAFASAHLSTLLAGPRETWMANLAAHSDYRTAGMVRALIAATDRALDTMPPDAVAMTELATSIADALPPAAYASDTVLKLRGASWRERAYALFYVGRYTEAEAAITTSERHFAACVVNEYDLGRADIVRALVHRVSGETSKVLSSAGRAVQRLAHSGDAHRYVSAVMTQAHAYISAHDYRAALSVLEKADREHGAAISPDTHARLLANLAHCHRELRDFRSAVAAYRAAATLFDDLAVRTEAARTRLNLAIVLRDAGNVTQAATEIGKVRGTFEELGMPSEVALSDLVLAEIALIARDFAQVELLCARSIRFFETAGVPYGPRAMTALAFVTEAARERRLTPAIVQHVQTFIRTLPSRPNLLFAPPPD